jgi:hypothetical protein
MQGVRTAQPKCCLQYTRQELNWSARPFGDGARARAPPRTHAASAHGASPLLGRPTVFFLTEHERGPHSCVGAAWADWSSLRPAIHCALCICQFVEPVFSLSAGRSAAAWFVLSWLAFDEKKKCHGHKIGTSDTGNHARRSPRTSTHTHEARFNPDVCARRQ